MRRGAGWLHKTQFQNVKNRIHPFLALEQWHNGSRELCDVSRIAQQQKFKELRIATITGANLGQPMAILLLEETTDIWLCFDIIITFILYLRKQLL